MQQHGAGMESAESNHKAETSFLYQEERHFKEQIELSNHFLSRRLCYAFGHQKKLSSDMSKSQC